MDKINHLLVIGPTTSRGGTYKRLLQWLSYLPENIQLSLIYWAKEGKLFQNRIASDFGGITNTYYSRSFDKLLRILIVPMILVVAIRIYKDKPVQIVSNLFYGDMVCLILCLIYKIFNIEFPYWAVYIAGDPVPVHRSKGLFSFFYKNIARLSMKYADRVILLSPNMEKELSEKYSIDLSSRYDVIPIAVEKRKSDKRTRNTSCIRFGVVSRLEPVKRVGDILSAFNSIVMTFDLKHGVHLDIWGSGSEQSKLTNMINELGLNEYVSFHGWLENPYEAYEQIDVFVMASQSEGTPRSILEAGSMGIPTVATRVGGVVDIIQENVDGLLFDVGDIESLAKAMGTFLERSIIDSFGRAIKQKVYCQHSPGVDVQKIFTKTFSICK